MATYIEHIDLIPLSRGESVPCRREKWLPDGDGMLLEKSELGKGIEFITYNFPGLSIFFYEGEDSHLARFINLPDGITLEGDELREVLNEEEFNWAEKLRIKKIQTGLPLPDHI